MLKVTANRATYQNMIDNMDIDASGVTEGEVSIEEAGASMLDEVLEVCNGKTTKAESYGFSDIAIDRICRVHLTRSRERGALAHRLRLRVRSSAPGRYW